MTKYTAADFANAKFAEHESGQAVALRWTQDYGSDPDDYWVYERPLNNRFSKEATHQEMADMGGWVPVPTKPTITESAYKLALDETRDPQYVYGFTDAMHLFGGEVIPDPEPTNAEKIIDLMGKAPANLNRRDLAAWLDKAGVTAPKEDGK